MLGAIVAVLGGCTLESGACAIWIAIKNLEMWSIGVAAFDVRRFTQGVSQLSPQS